LTNATPANVLRADATLPAMVIKASRLRNNLEVMADYVRERGCFLAPHGKTTMAPGLFRRQLEHGAWGITVGSVTQARVAMTAAPERILIANEVVGGADIAQLADWAERAGGAGLRGAGLRAGPEVRCLVDSVAGVRLLEEGLAAAGAPARVPVLLEIGVAGGRTGVRNRAEARAVVAAVSASDHVALTGVEGYEGGIGSDRDPGTLARVDRYLEEVRDVTLELAAAGAFSDRWSVVLTAGGSKYFDRVAAAFGEDVLPMDPRPDVVIRAGAYITHDHGIYAQVSPLAPGREPGRSLLPALEVWGDVLSVPEPSRAIVGVGRRDVPYDLSLPIPLQVAGRDGRPGPAPAGLAVTALDDQHCYLDMAAGRVQVGDRVGFGISHPCTAFDKWREVAIVDEDYNVVDTVSTYF
jgi:D-serine deaminase-like pyridoxal phosphate-dependent protein